MTSIYKITIPEIPGALYVNYVKGVLRELLLQFDEPITNGQWGWFMEAVPYNETEFKSLDLCGNVYKVQKLEPKTVQDKVVMFTMAYRTHFNVPYRPNKSEKANLKLVTCNRELLETYFTNTEYPLSIAKSMADYTKHFNYIRQITTNGKPSKSGFPDVYDREYEKKLEPGALSAYWAHLRAQGWTKTDGVWTKTNH